MQKLFLKKIRLTTYFLILFCVYALICLFVPKIKFDGSALTLFSVNSFLYGFYIAPILAGQKTRIEEIHKIIRTEANALFSMMLALKKYPQPIRGELKELIWQYVEICSRHQKATKGEVAYEKMITYCLDYKGAHTSEIEKFLDMLVANQQNRTNLGMQLSNRVYSNEWMVMIVLFAVTLTFVMLIDAGPSILYKLLAALLATGLSMLLVILLKMSTLTHKKAKQAWQPYSTLLKSHFYRIDEAA
ncbi:MAG: hypothetical protein WAQ25_00440 [Candidatus Saccharimonas sp.]